nr:glycosyltransferase family 2 protein [Solirubrobacterales bacterium]
MSTGTDAVATVVVPTFRGRERVADCLRALSGQRPPHAVLVVDDGSADGTADAIRDPHPGVRVLALPENVGFARAANAGLRAAETEFVVLLNDDVLVEPEFLAHILAPMQADPAVGMVACLLLQADGDVVEGLGVEADRALAGFSYGWGLPAARAAELRPDRVLGPSGGGAAYRTGALREVGFLEEALGAYNEDLDLALRLRAAGWSCAAAPDAVARHTGSATYGRRTGRQLYAKGFSRAYLMRRYGVLRRPRAAAGAVIGEATTIVWQ